MREMPLLLLKCGKLAAWNSKQRYQSDVRIHLTVREGREKSPQHVSACATGAVSQHQRAERSGKLPIMSQNVSWERLRRLNRKLNSPMYFQRFLRST